MFSVAVLTHTSTEGKTIMFTKKINQAQAIHAIVKSLRFLGDNADPTRDKKRILHDSVPLQAIVGFVPVLNGCKVRQASRGCVRTWTIEGPTQESVDSVLA